MNILYIHGLGGSGTGKISETLKSFGTVTSPSLKFDPEDNIQYLMGMVRTNLFDLVVGNSLGGLYARYIHTITGIETICINPPTQSNQFEQFFGENIYFDTGEKFFIHEVDTEDIEHIIENINEYERFVRAESLHVFVSADDEIVDPTIIRNDKYICEKNLHIITSATHRLTQDNIDEIFRISFSSDRIV